MREIVLGLTFIFMWAWLGVCTIALLGGGVLVCTLALVLFFPVLTLWAVMAQKFLDWFEGSNNIVSPIDRVANQNADTDAGWASEEAAHYALQGWQHDLAPQFED